MERKIVKVGELNIKNSRIRVTDPGYEPEATPSWCSKIISKIKRGIWECFAIISDEGEDWGERVAELRMQYKGEVVNAEGETLIGSVAVDSGQCGFFVDKSFKKVYNTNDGGEEWYNKVCHITDNDYGIVDDFGVVSVSGYGDGCYNVYATYDDNAEVVKISIEFISEDEDDDWDDEEDWEVTDINGNTVETGMKVKWHDPAIDEFSEEDRKIQEARVWTVADIAGDVILITDDGGEAEVFGDEIEVVEL